MRVILEVLSGPDAGRKTLLGAGQVLQVGRTDRADLSFPQDGHMSGLHLALETDDLACYVKDLGSSNGTLLNGQPLTVRAILHDGDKLRAGNTTFLVRTEGDAPEKAAVLLNTAPPAPQVSALPDMAGVSYSVETCDSGLTLCRGSVDEVQPHQLTAALARFCPAYFMADFKKLEGGLPEGLDSPAYLFDWFEPSVAAGVSPVLFAADEWAEWPAVVEQGWGEDAVICLFSSQEQSALLDHLRHSLKAKPHQDDPSQGIIGFCWPSVMAPLLANYTPQFVQQLLADIDMVLVEFPDLPLTWQLFGRPRITDLLDQLGFVQEPAEEVVSEPPQDQS